MGSAEKESVEGLQFSDSAAGAEMEENMQGGEGPDLARKHSGRSRGQRVRCKIAFVAC